MTNLADSNKLLEEYRQISKSSEEFIFDENDAIEFLNCVHQISGLTLLGYEGIVIYKEGDMGHHNEFQGTVSLENISSNEALSLCLRNIKKDAKKWKKYYSNLGKLLFCIVIDETKK